MLFINKHIYGDDVLRHTLFPSKAMLNLNYDLWHVDLLPLGMRSISSFFGNIILIERQMP